MPTALAKKNEKGAKPPYGLFFHATLKFIIGIGGFSAVIFL
jgi:hypothetical protein